MQEMLERIQKLELPLGRPALIALSGFGGAGKTTLAQQIKATIRDAEIISIDDFVSDKLCERSEDWSGFDRERFRRQVLEPARSGKSVRYEVYDFDQKQTSSWRSVAPSKYLLLEGCSILHPDLMPYYNLSIWIDCPLAVATERGICRDRALRDQAQSVYHDELYYEQLWHTVWMPNEQNFFTRYRPDHLAAYVYHEYAA